MKISGVGKCRSKFGLSEIENRYQIQGFRIYTKIVQLKVMVDKGIDFRCSQRIGPVGPERRASIEGVFSQPALIPKKPDSPVETVLLGLPPLASSHRVTENGDDIRTDGNRVEVMHLRRALRKDLLLVFETNLAPHPVAIDATRVFHESMGISEYGVA